MEIDINLEKINKMKNRYFDFLINPNFQGVNRLFVLSFKDENDRESYKQYYPWK